MATIAVLRLPDHRRRRAHAITSATMPNGRQYALGLKGIEDALEIRRRVLLAFETAEREPDAELRRSS